MQAQNKFFRNGRAGTIRLTAVNRFLMTILFSGLCPLVYGQVFADFSITTPGDSCLNRTVTLDASKSKGNISDYSWEIKNKVTGQSIETGKGVLITKNFITPGIYSATLTVSGAGGPSSLTKEIRVYYLPSVNFSADVMEGCPPLNVTFSNNSYPGDGTIIKSEWIFNDGNKDAGTTDESVNNTYKVSGLYSPTLIVTNSYGCKRSLTKDKYINIYNQTIPSYTVSNNTSCSIPNSVTFTNTTGDKNFNYTWDFGDGSTLTDNATTVSHEYTKPGNYHINLIAKNTTGACSGEAVIDSNKNVYVGKPVANFDMPPTVCTDNEISFNPIPDPTGVTDAGKWYFEDDGSIVDTLDAKHVFRNPGVWKVKFIAYNSYSKCQSDTMIKSVTVLLSPKSIVNVDNPGGCVAPHTINAQNTSGNAGSYVWNFGDGSSIIAKNDLSGVSHTYQSFGLYNLTLSATAENGCTTVDTVKIALAIPQIIAKPNVKDGCMPLALGIKALTNTADSIVSYSYDYGNGIINTSSSDTNYTIYSSPGTFAMKIRAKTKTGCDVESEAINIYVDKYCNTDGDTTLKSKTKSQGAISVKKYPDCKQKYTFEFRDTTINAQIISWNMDGVVLTDLSNPIKYTFPNPTAKKQFVVSVKLRDGTGKELEHGVRVVVVNEKANFSADKNDFCKNTEVLFKTIGIDSTHINKYFWNYGDYTKADTLDNKAYNDTSGFYLNGKTSHTYKWKGNFRPMLTIVDKFGCRDSLKQKTEIKVKAPEAQYNIDKGRFCTGDFTVNFTETNKTVSKTPIKEWKWSFGDNTTEVYTTETPVSHTYKNTRSFQNFQVRLTIIDSEGCVDTKDSNVTSYVPKVSFNTVDTLRCNKFDIMFKNTSLARVVDTNQYIWKYGNGMTSTGFKGHVVYADTGIYSVTLIVKDKGGCVDSAYKPGYVKIAKPVASFKVGSDTSKCIGTYSLPFTSTSKYANYYKWDFGDGEVSETDNVVATHFYKASGTYNVKLVVDGLDGCKDSVTVRLPIKGSYDDLDANDTLLCSGQTFTAVVHGQNIKNYYWDFGDYTPTNNLTTSDSVSHVYTKAGIYHPNVILITPQGCQTTVKTKNPVVVDSIINPMVLLNAEKLACKGEEVQFKASPVYPVPSGSKYNYSFYTESGQLLKSRDTSSMYLHVAQQTETVKAVIHSDYHCYKVDSAFSNTVKLDVIEKLNASIIPKGDTICEKKGNIELKAAGNNLKGVNYEWSLDNSLVKKSNQPERLVLNQAQQSGKYKLKVYNASCQPDSAYYTVKIYDKPELILPETLDVEYAQGQEIVIPLEINAPQTEDIKSIIWDKKQDLYYYEPQTSEKKSLRSEESVKNPVYIPQKQDLSSTYKVTVTSGPEKFACQSSASIKINNFIPSKIPNAFSPNGDGLNDTWVINGFAKYPNTKVVIFNRWGNTVYENKLGHYTPWDGTVNGTLLTQGTYYYVIEFNGSHDGSDHKADGSVTLVY